jgi:hypothetical protein
LRQFYVAQAYGRLRQYRAVESSGKKRARTQLRRALRMLHRTGYHKTLEAHRLCIEGAFEGEEGRPNRAEEHWMKAEELARNTDNPWVLAEVDYQRAHLALRGGNPKAAAERAQHMLRFARERGWEVRAREARQVFALT